MTEKAVFSYISLKPMLSQRKAVFISVPGRLCYGREGYPLRFTETRVIAGERFELRSLEITVIAGESYFQFRSSETVVLRGKLFLFPF